MAPSGGRINLRFGSKPVERLKRNERQFSAPIAPELPFRSRPVRAEPANMNVWPLSGGGAERLNDRLGSNFAVDAMLVNVRFSPSQLQTSRSAVGQPRPFGSGAKPLNSGSFSTKAAAKPPPMAATLSVAMLLGRFDGIHRFMRDPFRNPAPVAPAEFQSAQASPATRQPGGSLTLKMVNGRRAVPADLPRKRGLGRDDARGHPQDLLSMGRRPPP
jgi:hypothetical protein